MKIQELRVLAKEDLLARERSLLEELGKLNMQRFAGSVEKPHRFLLVKKEIAQINTLLNEKKEKQNGK